MRFAAHDYQRYAIDFILAHPRCALFLDMGLGKTAITLTAIHSLVLDSFDVSRVLVIAPLRAARDTWSDEAAKWDDLNGLEVACAVGSPGQRIRALESGAPVTTIGRENVAWLVRHYADAWPFDMVVLDESSSFKNHQSQRFKALKSVLPRITRMVALTGTPAANGLLDLWAQFRLLDDGERLGKYITHYRDRFFVPDKRSGAQVFSWRLRPGSDEQIHRLISDITVSMRSVDHLDLPPVTTTDVVVDLPAAARAHYEALREQMVLGLDGAVVDAGNAAGLSNKLLQMASGCVYDDGGAVVEVHRAKIDALADLIEAASGSPVMVAYWYASDLERLLQAVPGAVELRSAESMRQWNAGRIPVGLIHPASAGHGLNLQAGGHHLVWFTAPWSLELYQQTNARLARQGQTHPVSIHHLIAAGTIDVDVLRALERKDVTQSALVDAVRAQLTTSRALRSAA